MSSPYFYPGPDGGIIPTFRTPLTDRVQSMFTHHGYDKCSFFELQHAKCMEAYGSPLGRQFCDLEWRDFMECTRNIKEILRWEAIRAERRKKFAEGKLDRPFLRDYPPTDLATPDYFNHSRYYQDP